MATILDLLNTNKGGQFISATSKATSESRENTATVMGMTLPLLLGAMAKLSRSQAGRDELVNFLNTDKHRERFLEKPDEIQTLQQNMEGEKFIALSLGTHGPDLISNLSRVLEMEQSTVAEFVHIGGQLLMSILAFQIKNDKIDSSGLEDLLHSLLGSSGKFDSSFLETILNNNTEGNVLDNEDSMNLGGGKKGKNDGGILGGMVGGK